MKPGLIVALDVDTLKKAEEMVDRLVPSVKMFKIGSQLFTAYGPEAVRMVVRKGGSVFLDLKFHDIPNTVRNAVAAGTQQGVFMMTVHASGGSEMLRAAAEGAAQKAKELKITRPLIVGVTVLTSGDAPDAGQKVLALAKAAEEAGIDGIVCSVHETASVRRERRQNFVIVNPGIRPAGAEKGDQKRVATPQEAARAGATYIVVGRPVLEAGDPRKAAEMVLRGLDQTLGG
ncbi:MAG: orotidine-5'-phosphate decarboxylase [Deltaproteobacteria bacterium]